MYSGFIDHVVTLMEFHGDAAPATSDYSCANPVLKAKAVSLLLFTLNLACSFPLRR